MTTADQITELKSSLQALLKKYSALAAQNADMQVELKTLREEKVSLSKEFSLMREKHLVQSAANGNMPAAEKREFELKINAYIRNIDHCIAMLGNKEANG